MERQAAARRRSGVRIPDSTGAGVVGPKVNLRGETGAKSDRRAILAEPVDHAQAGDGGKMRVEREHGGAGMKGVGGDQNILRG